MAFGPPSPWHRIEAGDDFAVYVAQKAFARRIERTPQIVAVGTVAAAPRARHVEVAERSYSATCDLSFEYVLPLGSGAAFGPLVPRLSAILCARAGRRWAPAAPFGPALLYDPAVHRPRDGSSQAVCLWCVHLSTTLER